jgi:tripartite-type tricarboxylate transporter receptor subunit TctC
MRMLNTLAMVLAAIVAVTLGGPSAWAQSGALKIVVPYTPGSGPDILSRLMSEQIPRDGGPTVVVENRPGGGTVIGTEAAMRAEPDGHTVLLVANSFVANPTMRKVNYDVAKNFEPVCYLAASPMVLVVLGSSPYKSVQDLVGAAKANPGKIAFASGGPGSSLHVSIEVLRLATKIDITYVPFGGTAPAINSLMGGHVQAVWADYPTVVSHLKSGTLRGLVTTSSKRVPLLPDVPTLSETGISKYEADIFYGVMAPAKTPPEALKRLTGWFSTALKADGMQPKLDKQGLLPVGMCGKAFGDYLRNMGADYARIVKEAGIKLNR